MDKFISIKNPAVMAGEALVASLNEETMPALTPEDIRCVTDMARGKTASQAARLWNQKHPDKRITERSVQRWKRHYDTTRTYFEPSKRGPKDMMLASERQTLSTTFDSIRKSGTPVTSFLFAQVARGIVQRSRPDLGKQDRVALFSTSWARDEMRRMGLNVRRGTTDRTVPASQIKKDGLEFYASLSSCGVQHKSLLFNMDEFFLKLDNGGQNWTWERVRRGEKKNVAISTEKLGFTCAILYSTVFKFLPVTGRSTSCS